MINMYDEMYGDCIVCELKSNVPETSVYHRHDGFEIYLLVNGKLDYYVNTESYRLTDGHMVIMKPGEYRSFKAQMGCSPKKYQSRSAGMMK